MNITTVWDVTSCSAAEITYASGRHVVSIFGPEVISSQKSPPTMKVVAADFFAAFINFYMTTGRDIPKGTVSRIRSSQQITFS